MVGFFSPPTRNKLLTEERLWPKRRLLPRRRSPRRARGEEGCQEEGSQEETREEIREVLLQVIARSDVPIFRREEFALTTTRKGRRNKNSGGPKRWWSCSRYPHGRPAQIRSLKLCGGGETWAK